MGRWGVVGWEFGGSVSGIDRRMTKVASERIDRDVDSEYEEARLKCNRMIKMVKQGHIGPTYLDEE
jgi:hypothetical protein